MIEAAVVKGAIRETESEFDEGHGAQCLFVGRVRKVNHGKSVVAVEYDCFEPLAEKVFRQLAEEVRELFARDAVVQILHAQGRLAVGEASVRIAVSTRHRDESFKACRYLIEEIKKRAPIWKKEFYEGSASEWVQGHALCQHQEQAHGT